LLPPARKALPLYQQSAHLMIIELTLGKEGGVYDVKALQILAVGTVQGPVRLPYPTPARRMASSRRKENDGIVGLH
jgi:hypothetical protein